MSNMFKTLPRTAPSKGSHASSQNYFLAKQQQKLLPLKQRIVVST